MTERLNNGLLSSEAGPSSPHRCACLKSFCLLVWSLVLGIHQELFSYLLPVTDLHFHRCVEA